MAGLFLSIDGIDGCGKSTQIELLREWLVAAGHEVLVVRDPGGTQLGETLRDILLHRQEIPLDMTAEMLLYMASRAQLVAELIRPALSDGKTVLADRFLLANVVYQGNGGGLDPNTIWKVGEVATGGLRPSQTFLLDLEPAVAQQRMGGQRDRLESRGVEYMTRVRDGFLAQSRCLESDLTVVDATQAVDVVFNTIKEVVQSRLTA